MSRAVANAARILKCQAGRVAIITLLAAALWVVPAAAAEPAPPGAAACSGCHALPSAAGAMPGLADKTVGEIAQDMRAFKTGAREATVMDRIAKGFSDEEIQAIAEWLAGNRATVKARAAQP